MRRLRVWASFCWAVRVVSWERVRWSGGVALAVREEGVVPALGWDGAVAYDVTAGLGEGDEEGYHEDGREDDEEPEDPAPAEKLRENASQYGSDGGSDHGPGSRPAHPDASFSARGNVGYHSGRQRYRT